MIKKQIFTGEIHKVPADLKKALGSIREVQIAWNEITSLARNEWICWVESAKKPETRNRRIKRTCEDLMNGKRRPCCWAGCSHR
jgi:uncharacterized protein YdeI (YjbR/CyaY-like superfamily)